MATFDLSVAMDQSRTYGDEELFAVREGDPEWQHGLEEALGNRPSRENISRELEVSIQAAGSRLPKGIMNQDISYRVILEWTEYRDRATEYIPDNCLGTSVYYKPCGAVLKVGTGSFDENLVLFRRLARVVGVDWRRTLPFLPPAYALELLRAWRDKLRILKELPKDEVLSPMRTTLRSEVARDYNPEAILSRVEYLISSLESDVCIVFKRDEKILADGREALSGHLRFLSMMALSIVYRLGPTFWNQPLDQILGMLPTIRCENPSIYG